MVAEKLDKKLRENSRDARNSLFTGDSMQAGQIRFKQISCFNQGFQRLNWDHVSLQQALLNFVRRALVVVFVLFGKQTEQIVKPRLDLQTRKIEKLKKRLELNGNYCINVELIN